MSTSPETSERVDDRLVNVISRWLARHLPDDELRRELDRVEPRALEPGQEEAVEELRSELGQDRDRAELEMVARETLEALALGGYPFRVFTGIVRERGRVLAAEQNGGGVRRRIAAPQTAASASPGDSVAVSGVCLTAVAVNDGELAFDAVPESLSRTTLRELAGGEEVNLEPAL